MGSGNGAGRYRSGQAIPIYTCYTNKTCLYWLNLTKLNVQILFANSNCTRQFKYMPNVEELGHQSETVTLT